MSQPAEKDAPYEVTRRDGLIIAACVCGAGESVIDKGLGRATIAAWRTRHQDCTRGLCACGEVCGGEPEAPACPAAALTPDPVSARAERMGP